MSFKNPSPRQAALELIIAGSLWGFGFVATQWALSTWNPPGVLLWRFAGALILGEILHLIFNFKNKNREPKAWLWDFKLALPAGFLLGSFLLLQTVGLQYTSASKSGFITTLYVIFVPAINFFIFKKRFTPKILILAFVACVGTYLLMGLHAADVREQINQGDLWTLASAVIGAFHIIYIGRITQKLKDPFRVNNFQSFGAMLIVLPVLLFYPHIQTGAVNGKSLAGIFIIAAACSVLAFFIQVRAQKVLSDTTASMLFLLESPYAFFFAYLLMDDRLAVPQAIGAVMIVIAALGTVVLEQSAPTSKTRSE